MFIKNSRQMNYQSDFVKIKQKKLLKVTFRVKPSKVNPNKKTKVDNKQ